MAELSARSLWVTLRGASPWGTLAWVLWMGLAAAGAVVAADAFGPAGPPVAMLAAGWMLARRLPSPLQALRRVHLDDAEVTLLGPGRRVRRFEWARIDTVTQGSASLVVSGPGLTAVLPLGPATNADVWFHVLQRLVPPLAEELWERLEAGVIRLAPACDPPARVLAWWAWMPALVAGAVVGMPGVVLVVALAAAERVVAYGLRERWTVTIHPGGLSFREGRGFFAPWERARVTPEASGLRVRLDEHTSGFVSSRIPNFWAVAAVVQLRAQVGPECPSRVHFRLRFANGGLAVVGEFDGA